MSTIPSGPMRERAPTLSRALDRKIRVHDRHQFELKLEYQPSEVSSRSLYTVEAFVCVPASLNVSAETAPARDLYVDIHNYIRLKTPEMSWEGMKTLAASPLVRAAEELRTVEAGADPARFGYECKLWACVFRAGLRTLVDEVERCLSGVVGPDEIARAAAFVESEMAGALDVAAAFRAFHVRVDRKGIAENARAAARLADEYASVSIEQKLRRAIVLVDRADLRPEAHGPAKALAARLLELILAEERVRRERGYPSIIDPGTDNEPYVYRAGLLKKYCSSALFLHIRRLGVRRTWQELLFAIAAGIAMAFATVIAFWAQAQYAGLGVRLFVILTVAYMFKDRIKEGTRALFARFLEKRLYDRKIVIGDPAGGVLGTCREKIQYLAPGELPPEVREIRRRGAEPVARLAEEELQESVIHYKKEIALDARRLLERGPMAALGAGVTDIARFNIERFLRDMDEPHQKIEYVDQSTGSIGPIRAAKVYHVDVVFRFAAREANRSATSLMRLILDRRGIKRIERIEGDARLSDVRLSALPPDEVGLP